MPAVPHPIVPAAETPLLGRTVLITRSREQSAVLARRFENLGARSLIHPVIEIAPVSSHDPSHPLDQRLVQLANSDDRVSLVFASGNGVAHFFRRWRELELPTPALTRVRWMAIGASTGDRLADAAAELLARPTDSIRHEIQIPPRADSESLTEFLLNHPELDPVLALRGNRGSHTLRMAMEGAGRAFEELVVYQSLDVDRVDSTIAAELNRARVDWITITSSAIARSAIALFRPWLAPDQRDAIRTVSISPGTSEVMRQLGVPATAEAARPGMDGIVDAVLDWETR